MNNYTTEFVARPPLPRGLRDALESGAPLGLDVENHYVEGREEFPTLITLQIADEHTAWVIDARTVNLANTPVIRDWLADPARKKRIHHAAHEAKVLRLNGLPLAGVEDTCLAAKLLLAGVDFAAREAAGLGASLKAVTKRYLGVDLDKGLQTSFTLTGSLTPAQVEYAAMDAIATHRLWPVLAAECNRLGLGPVLALECALVTVFDALGAAGVPVDRALWDKTLADIEATKAESEEILANLPDPESMLGVVGRLNLHAPKAVEAMFARLGVVVDNVRKETLGPLQRALTEADNLTEAQRVQLCAITAYLNWKEAAKLLEWKDRPDGDDRLRGDWNQLLVTGRAGVSNHPVQTIPRQLRGALGGHIGKELRKLDYGNQEGRIIAALSGDEGLIAELNDPASDAHQELADEAGTTRDRAKKARFAFWYGRGEREMAVDLDLPVAQTRALRKALADRYPKALQFLREPPLEPAEITDMTSGLAGEWLQIRTADRRRLFAPARHKGILESNRREAGNFRVQATAATMSKRALGKASKLLAERFGDAARIVNFVHDELVLEADADIADAAAETVKEAMQWAFQATIGDIVRCEVGVSGSTHYLSD